MELRKMKMNGTECYRGEVKFISPGRHRQLLNPFVRVEDESGNRYRVRGLLGHLIAVASAKSGEKAGVVCRKTGEKNYEVLNWY